MPEGDRDSRMDSAHTQNGESHAATEKELIAEIVTAFARHKALLATVFLATVISAYGIGQLRTELYETTANVVVKLGRENLDAPATVQKGSVMATGVRKEQLHTEVQMLSARSLVEEVVDQFGVETFLVEAPRPQTFLQAVKYSIKRVAHWIRAQIGAFLVFINVQKELTDREKIILGIEGALSVEAERDSDVIVAKLLYPNPDLAVLVLQTLLQLYLDHHVRVWQDMEVTGFFDAQVANYRQKLHDLETERENVKAKWNLVAVAEQRSLLLQHLEALKTQLQSREIEQATLRARQAAMRVQLKNLPDELRQSRELKPNPSVQSIKERLTNLRQERVRFSTLYRPEVQRVQNLEREIAELERLLEEEDSTQIGSVTMETNPLKQTFENSIEETEVQIAGMESSVQQLRAQADAVRETLERLNSGERQLDGIEREHRIAEQTYLSYVQRKTESMMAEELDRRRIVNVAVLSPPAKSLQPVSPRRLFLLGISVPIGLLLGAALALLAEYFNDVVNSPRDLSGIDGCTYLGAFSLENAPPLGESSPQSGRSGPSLARSS